MRFTEVDFSELILLRQPTTKSSKNQFGRSEVQPSVVGKSLLISPEYLEGLIFSATFRRKKSKSSCLSFRYGGCRRKVYKYG